mgnify:CR=1 FL=1
MAIFKHEPSPVPEGMEPCEVPLIEQLRSVPKNYMTCAPIQWDEAGNETGHRFIPVGLMMHRAAEELERLAALESPQEGHCNSCDTWRLCELHMKCLNPPKAAERCGFPPSTVDALLEPYLAATRAERAGKQQAYLERSHLVAALARMFYAGIRQTKIDGWSPDWYGCVYIDLPSGQISYHYHDSHAHLFDGLPPYNKPWDGHDKDTVHKRLSELSVASAAPRSKS